ncbi:MAG: hypothetical protein JST68_21430 [Bacteroidetes bacterium]|nr:hypothetical protein [Bacteroidota bacterium]
MLTPTEIVSFISGAVIPAAVILGLTFVSGKKLKDDQLNPKDVIIRTGLQVLSTVVKIGFIVLGIYGIYYIINLFYQKREESRLQKEHEQWVLNRQVHLKQLLDIANTSYSEMPMQIEKLDFENNGSDDLGKKYIRDGGDELIRIFSDGAVRYESKTKEGYLRVYDEAKKNGFVLVGERLNQTHDSYTDFKKDNYSASFGYFTNSRVYWSYFENTNKNVTPIEYISNGFMIGTWDRAELSHNGRYTFREDKTFTFDDSHDGMITGRWNVSDKDISLHYDKKRVDQYSNHALSLKLEIIHVTRREYSKIEGYIGDNSFMGITLSR